MCFKGNKIGTDITGTLAAGQYRCGYDVLVRDRRLVRRDRARVRGTWSPSTVATGSTCWVRIRNSSSRSRSRRTRSSGIRAGAFTWPSTGFRTEFAVAPVMTFTPAGGGNVTLSGTFKPILTPQNPYVVEIYSNPTVPAAGHEQGQTFVQSVPVTTNSSGVGTFSVTLPTGIYTATATDAAGNTSQFSLATAAPALDATVTTVSSTMNPSTVGQAVTFTAVVTAPTSQGPRRVGDIHHRRPGAPVRSRSSAAPTRPSSRPPRSRRAHTISAAYSGDATFATSTGSLPTRR